MNETCLEFQNAIGDAISTIRFASQSNNLLISSWDCNLRLYDADSSILRFEAPSEAALLDCCFQDDLIVFSAGSDGSIRRYDFEAGTLGTIGNHDHIATCVEYSAETRHVISTGLDKNIMSWDVRMAKGLAYEQNLGAEVESMSISGHCLMLAMGTSVYMYDLRNLDGPVQSKESKMDTRIKCISSVPYCEGFAAGSVDGRVALEISHPSNSEDLGYIFRCRPKSKDDKYHLVSVNDIAFSPTTFGAFVTGDNEGYVTGWDAQSKRRLFELPRCPNSVASLSYNREGQLLAVASSYTYGEANEIETPPQIFLYEVDDIKYGPVSAERSSSSRK